MKNILFGVIILMLVGSSCAPIMQKAYFVTSPNVNCFERKNEKNVKASLFFNHIEAQSNFAITDKFGLSADIYGALHGQFGFEVGGIYYRNFSEKHYFETRAGYGYFNNQADIGSMRWDFSVGEYGTSYSQSVSTNYHKIIVQPTYCYNPGKVTIGIALKFGANYFENYHYAYSIWDHTSPDYSDEETSNCDYKGQWGVSFEPALKVQFNSRFFLQCSGIITGTVKNSPVIYTHYVDHEHNETRITGDLSNPTHVYFLFSIGYELKLGKKKETQ